MDAQIFFDYSDQNTNNYDTKISLPCHNTSAIFTIRLPKFDLFKGNF